MKNIDSTPQHLHDIRNLLYFLDQLFVSGNYGDYYKGLLSLERRISINLSKELFKEFEDLKKQINVLLMGYYSSIENEEVFYKKTKFLILLDQFHRMLLFELENQNVYSLSSEGNRNIPKYKMGV